MDGRLGSAPDGGSVWCPARGLLPPTVAKPVRANQREWRDGARSRYGGSSSHVI